MTALRKKDGGVRAIVVGRVIRRLVARTVAQQLGPAVEAATSPFQHALSSRAGCECISHVLQALSELDADATVTSIDGISAYDTTSRRAMLQGLERMPGGVAVSPFVRLFYSSPSEYLWEDDGGEVHSIHQGEGGEKAMSSCRCCSPLGQHAALEAISRRLRPGGRLFAFLDDIWFVTKPERVGDVHNLAERELWREAGIQVHTGKTHVWNRSGTKPPECDAMQRRAVVDNPDARVWLGTEVPTRQQGTKVLGCSPGHDDFIAAELQALGAKHQILLQAIPAVQDLQSAWLLLLHCAAARANYVVRVLRLDVVQPFAQSHDTNVWQCLCNIMGIPGDGCSDVANLSHTPPRSGRVGVEECSRNMRCRSLGKLGGHSSHDRC